MNISISPIKLNNINFRATENGSKDKVAKEKKVEQVAETKNT